MSSIPSGVICMWDGTNASIPTGWTRETSLDGKYPKAWGSVNPDVTGGSNTHQHTAASHGHTMTNHAHSVTTNTWVGPASYSNRNDQVADNHYHQAANTSSSSDGALQGYVVTWGSVNQEPPYHNIIFIKPSSGYAAIQSNIHLLWNEEGAPTGWTHCDGSGGTNDIRNRYIKGAATGGDAGGTGGALNHSHSVTHGHTANSHSHAGTTGAFCCGGRGNADAQSGAHQSHTHTIYLSAATDSVNNYTNTSAGSGDTVEVLYKKLAVIKNTSGTIAPIKKGMIALWLGSTDAVPTGWYLCDGSNGTPDLRNYFIKCVNLAAEVGDTGGANTHTHTNVNHTHTSTGAHSHGSASTSGPSIQRNADTGGDGGSSGSHTHGLGTCSSTTPSYSSDDLTSGSAVNNEPSYRTAAFIQYQFSVGGGVLAGMM